MYGAAVSVLSECSCDQCVCVSQPYYVDEDDFWKACDQKQLLVIDRYLATGGHVNACDAVGHQHSIDSTGSEKRRFE